MANLFWVGGTATWNSVASTKWATTSGGAGGAAIPTTADDVYFDANSGAGTTTLSGNSTCRSINFTGYTGTISHPAGTNFNIGDGTAGAGNIALKFVAGMTYTLGNVITSEISFNSTSTTAQDVDFAGKTTGKVTYVGIAGSWKLTGVHNMGATATLTILAGTLDTNNQTCSWGLFVSTITTSSRTLTMGSSAVTITGVGTSWNANITNLTYTAGTYTVTLTGAGSSMTVGASTSFNNVVMAGSGTSQWISSGVTVANFTRTGTATKTDAFQMNTGALTVTGALTLTGDSVTNRLQVFSNTVGTVRALSAATVNLSNVNFRDINANGAASPFIGSSLGDLLGNSDITFDTPTTRYGVAAGNWSSTAVWSTSSGGGAGATVPLPQDDVVLDANSAAGTYTIDMPHAGQDLTCTGFTRTLTSSTSHNFYGNYTHSTGMTYTAVSTLNTNGRGTHTITTGGKLMPNYLQQAFGGTYTFQDNWTSGAGNDIDHRGGTMTATTQNIVTRNFFSTTNGAGTRTLNMGSGTWTITGSGAVWTVVSIAVLNAQTSTIVMSDASTTTKTFAGGGFVYNNLTYDVANSPGGLTITGANTFNVLTVGSGRILTMPASTTNTFTSFNVNGADFDYQYLGGLTGHYISAPDSAALDITGDITLDAKIAMNDWTPSGNIYIVAKREAVGQYSYRMGVSTGGELILAVSGDGTAESSRTGDAATGFTNGSTGWIRASWRASDSRVQFFTKVNDGDAWVQLGTNNTVGTAPIFSGTSILEFGSLNAGTINNMSGKIYRTRVYNAEKGSTESSTNVQFDADFTTKTLGANSFIEASPNGATVSINNTHARVGDGRVSLVSSTGGTSATLTKPSGVVSNDYLSIQDSTATGGAQWYAGANSTNVSGNTGWIFTVPPTNLGNFFLMF